MGQFGSALGSKGTYEPEPSGFSGSEWAARLTGMGARGLGQGMQNYMQQNQAIQNRGGGGGMMQPSMGQESQLFPSYMGQSQDALNQAVNQRPRNQNFYGYGGG
jgi:hypothetical protein